MNEKTIAAIPFRDGAYSSFEETLRDASQSIELASAQGADLAVLPETINLLHRHNPSTPLDDLALDNWHEKAALICETAARCKIAVVLPLLVCEAKGLANRFFLIGKDGATLGSYKKRVPTPEERALGVQLGNDGPIGWEGLRLGGAICIDVYYPHLVFDQQLDAGADLFVIPSLTPAGSVLDAHAVVYSVPFVLAYSPWSRILDRDGTEVAAGGYRSETLRFGFGSPIQLATLNFDAMTFFADRNQEKMEDIARRYGRDVRIRFNQHNCIFTVESRSADLSVKEIMRQFGLVSRRDHFARQDPTRSNEAGDRFASNRDTGEPA